jgi:hypothetical protein
VLLQRGCNVNAVNTKNGKTALVAAAAGGFADVVAVLVDEHCATVATAAAASTVGSEDKGDDGVDKADTKKKEKKEKGKKGGGEAAKDGSGGALTAALQLPTDSSGSVAPSFAIATTLIHADHSLVATESGARNAKVGSFTLSITHLSIPFFCVDKSDVI